MTRTPHQDQKVREALGPKMASNCPVCKQENTYLLYDKYHMIELRSLPTSAALSDSVVPCLVVGCTNCGLTMYFSIYTLGLAEVLGVPPPGEAV